MPSRSPRTRLNDIRENIALARSFVADMSLEQFSADIRTIYAVIRSLEIISEASRRLPADVKARHPEISWADVAGAGNFYRHDYEKVAVDIVWRTIRKYLAPLDAIVADEIARLET